MKRFLTLLLAFLLLTLSAMPALGESAFTLTFTFADRSEFDFALINQALSGLMLTGLKLEDEKGYAFSATTTENGVSTTEYGYGFDSLTLSCETGDEPIAFWQMGAAVYPSHVYANGSEFKADWDIDNPESVIRQLITYDYGDVRAFIYIYHPRIDD